MEPPLSPNWEISQMPLAGFPTENLIQPLLPETPFPPPHADASPPSALLSG